MTPENSRFSKRRKRGRNGHTHDALGMFGIQEGAPHCAFFVVFALYGEIIKCV